MVTLEQLATSHATPYNTHMNQETRHNIERIKAAADKQIFVTFEKEGIHKYPAALTDPALATGDDYDVSFLGYPHRHIFHFNVAIDVVHSDRDIEFIQFKRWLENLYKGGVLSLDYRSCEMMADDLYEQIAARYPNRKMTITISEDGENGATIKYAL
jgi:hypothetical protein